MLCEPNGSTSRRKDAPPEQSLWCECEEPRREEDWESGSQILEHKRETDKLSHSPGHQGQVLRGFHYGKMDALRRGSESGVGSEMRQS